MSDSINKYSIPYANTCDQFFNYNNNLSLYELFGWANTKEGSVYWRSLADSKEQLTPQIKLKVLRYILCQHYYYIKHSYVLRDLIKSQHFKLSENIHNVIF